MPLFRQLSPTSREVPGGRQRRDTRRVGGLPTKQLIERNAKGERYERYRKRHWFLYDPRQLRLPFKSGDGE